jgi:3-hydroxyisobutyrate dehydrogenase-like beta-hydroxyacid dehydrogenase
MKIGMIGLGPMGANMALRLPPSIVWLQQEKRP